MKNIPTTQIQEQGLALPAGLGPAPQALTVILHLDGLTDTAQAGVAAGKKKAKVEDSSDSISTIILL